MVDDTQLTKLSHKLGIAAAEMEIARHFVDGYGGFSEPYENPSEGYDDLSGIRFL